MNHKLQLLLHNHFNWSIDFSQSIPISENSQAILEQYLVKLEEVFHLKPLQLMKLIERKQTNRIFEFLEACFEICYLTNTHREKIVEKKLNQAINQLIESGFSHQQLLEINPHTYISKSCHVPLFNMMKFLSSIYIKYSKKIFANQQQMFFNSSHTSLETISSTSIDLVYNQEYKPEIDEDILEILRLMP